MRISPRILLLLLAVAFGIQPAFSQDFELDDLGINLPGVAKEAVISTELVTGSMDPGATAFLKIYVSLPANHYIYSTNKEVNEVSATVIELMETPGLEAVDDGFTADRKPKTVYEEILKRDNEKFYDDVTWTKRFKIVDPANAAVKGKLDGQFCTAGTNDGPANCTPIPTTPIEAELQLDEELAAAVEAGPVFSKSEIPTRGSDRTADPLSLAFKLTPEDAGVDDEVTLTVTMKLNDGWHAYAQTQNPEHTGLPTVLKITETAGLEPLGTGFSPDRDPEEKDPFKDGKTQKLFHGTVTWSRKFKVTDGQFAVNGSVEYQVCEETCLAPKTVTYDLGHPDVVLTSFQEAEGPVEAADLTMILYYAGLAFLGGLVLNVMPCVLPVLAIKVLSFAKQAGESRARILVLNLAYSVGVIVVFLALAGFAVGLAFGGEKLGWGQLFQRPEFNLVMAGVIFAMGLSLLGVFEIPIPGMGGGSDREGPLGAFLTGIFATLLATPCSGPFMGVTLAWSAKQTPTVTFLVWGVMGLGMASPYILFAIIPGAVKLLPKPGMWMVRFKEACGFALLGTVIYFFHILDDSLTVPLLISLLGVGVALWMIGSLYQHNSATSLKAKVRTGALAMAAAGMLVGWAYTWEGLKLPWQDFSESRLTALLKEDKAVMIDFTADWCLVCKTNEKVALNKQGTLDFVTENDIVPLYADYTQKSPEIKKWLDKFDSNSIPLTVIFPPGTRDPSKAIKMSGPFTEGQLLEQLKKALETGKTAAKPDKEEKPEVAQASASRQ